VAITLDFNLVIDGEYFKDFIFLRRRKQVYSRLCCDDVAFDFHCLAVDIDLGQCSGDSIRNEDCLFISKAYRLLLFHFENRYLMLIT